MKLYPCVYIIIMKLHPCVYLIKAITELHPCVYLIKAIPETTSMCVPDKGYSRNYIHVCT